MVHIEVSIFNKDVYTKKGNTRGDSDPPEDLPLQLIREFDWPEKPAKGEIFEFYQRIPLKIRRVKNEWHEDGNIRIAVEMRADTTTIRRLMTWEGKGHLWQVVTI